MLLILSLKVMTRLNTCSSRTRPGPPKRCYFSSTFMIYDGFMPDLMTFMTGFTHSGGQEPQF